MKTIKAFFWFLVSLLKFPFKVWRDASNFEKDAKVFTQAVKKIGGFPRTPCSGIYRGMKEGEVVPVEVAIGRFCIHGDPMMPCMATKCEKWIRVREKTGKCGSHEKEDFDYFSIEGAGGKAKNLLGYDQGESKYY